MESGWARSAGEVERGGADGEARLERNVVWWREFSGAISRRSEEGSGVAVGVARAARREAIDWVATGAESRESPMMSRTAIIHSTTLERTLGSMALRLTR